jgi:hypothetical protein
MRVDKFFHSTSGVAERDRKWFVEKILHKYQHVCYVPPDNADILLDIYEFPGSEETGTQALTGPGSTETVQSPASVSVYNSSTGETTYGTGTVTTERQRPPAIYKRRTSSVAVCLYDLRAPRDPDGSPPRLRCFWKTQTKQTGGDPWYALGTALGNLGWNPDRAAIKDAVQWLDCPTGKCKKPKH